MRKLIFDLWWFIENVSEDTPDRQERFFALRERVRALQTSPKPATWRSVLINRKRTRKKSAGKL